MKNFLAHDDATRREMLSEISKTDIEELFSQLPSQARCGALGLGDALSEMEAQKRVRKLAGKNNVDKAVFLGGGAYNKFVPACISQVAQRFEFLTAYTPYQPEISQGTLQVMYEYQTMICRLTGMDVANASVYDGATACAEAVLMAKRISKKDIALISSGLNPEYKKVVETYCWANGIKAEYFDTLPTDTSTAACVLVQTPDYYGEIVEPKKTDALLIVCCEISTLSWLKPPSVFDADIVVGDIQTLGAGMNYGGPYGGYMACREKFMRQLPGRLAGRTVDADGNQAFTLTIQTREQHIKREKATSNICSNQALVALCANLYLSLLGEKGFKQVNYLASRNAHVLAEELVEKGIEVLTKNFFNEFVIKVDDADRFLQKLADANILGGIKLDEHRILVAATEMNTQDEIDAYVESV